MKLKNYAILLLPLMLFTASDASRSPRATPAQTAAESIERPEVQASRTAVRTTATGATRATTTAAERNAPAASRSAIPQGQAPNPRATGATRGAATGASRSGVQVPRTILRKDAPALGGATSRSALSRPNMARSAVATAQVSGASEYEACRATLFECMDQFCTAKSEEYKRCSCSDTLNDIEKARGEMQRAQDKLIDVNDNMFVVGLGRAEAAALVKETEGETASANKTDASKNKSVLDSVMASIGGGEVKTDKLKTGSPISLDINENTWGVGDTAVAGVDLSAYKGRALFNVVMGMCKPIIGDACKGRGHLDRASAAYDILVEQDCTTISKALKASGQKLSDSVRQTSVNLSAARIENYDNINSLSEGECISRLQEAMTAPSACGENYKFCLDTGRYIDQKTGGILPNATNLSSLRDMITFSQTESAGGFDNVILSGEGVALKRLIASKLDIVSGPILDKCDAIRDQVRQRYMDLALAEIHYIHMDKLEEFKGVCMTDVRTCYDKFGAALQSMASEANVKNILEVYISPEAAKVLGQKEMCAVKIFQCDELIGGNVIENFVQASVDYTLENTCRQLVRDCFSSLGGAQYLNFLKPNPVRGLTYEVGRGKQAILQGFGQTRPGVFYNSLCHSVLEQAKPCQEISPDRRAAIFGIYDFTFTNNDWEVMLDTQSIERQVFSAQTSGVAGEVYKMVQAELTRQCEMRNGTFRPLLAPFTNQDTLTIMTRLNAEGKNRIFDNFGNLLQITNNIVLRFATQEEIDLNISKSCSAAINTAGNDCDDTLRACYSGCDSDDDDCRNDCDNAYDTCFNEIDEENIPACNQTSFSNESNPWVQCLNAYSYMEGYESKVGSALSNFCLPKIDMKNNISSSCLEVDVDANLCFDNNSFTSATANCKGFYRNCPLFKMYHISSVDITPFPLLDMMNKDKYSLPLSCSLLYESRGKYSDMDCSDDNRYAGCANVSVITKTYNKCMIKCSIGKSETQKESCESGCSEKQDTAITEMNLCRTNADNNFIQNQLKCQIGNRIYAKPICPSDWEDIVDIYSWGICECMDGIDANGTCRGGGGK